MPERIGHGCAAAGSSAHSLTPCGCCSRSASLGTAQASCESSRQRPPEWANSAQTMISASIGLKPQAASREFYLERLKVAIELLVR